MSGAASGLAAALRDHAEIISVALAPSSVGGSGTPETEAAPVETWVRERLIPAPLLEAAARVAAGGVFPSGPAVATLIMPQQPEVAFTLHEQGFAAVHRSSQTTVGEALGGLGIVLTGRDRVLPAIDTPLQAGTHIYVRHAVSARLIMAGADTLIYTHGDTVGDMLAEAGIKLEPMDRVIPGAGERVRGGMSVSLTTVRDVTEVVEEPLEFDTIFHYDTEVDEGRRLLVQAGSNGSVRREYLVRVVDGDEVSRSVIAETSTAPTDEVIAIGTYVRPVVRAPAVTAPTGELACASTLNVYATWYSAASAGGSTTATGTGVYKGIVAVDPRVIPLGTRMYIPGYGYGVAADTGGGIRGNMIDLGYGADDLKDWRTRWIDICILP